MKKWFLKNSISFVQGYQDFSKDELEKLQYGIEGLYLTITKLFIIFIVAFLFGIFKEVLAVVVFFNIIRFTGFGFHAEKSYQCLILSLLYFVVLPMLFININLSNFWIFLICLICIFSYLLFAPADTVKRPLPNKKKRIIRKFSTVLIGIIYTSFILVFSHSFFAPLLLSALVIQAIVIQPAIYLLFGQPYNNYKNYVKA